MSATAATALDEALALTASMHAAALGDDWPVLAALDARRRTLVEQVCAQPTLDTVGLALLRERNDALIARVRVRRESLAGEWSDSQHSQRAMRDYQRVARARGAS